MELGTARNNRLGHCCLGLILGFPHMGTGVDSRGKTPNWEGERRSSSLGFLGFWDPSQSLCSPSRSGISGEALLSPTTTMILWEC